MLRKCFSESKTMFFIDLWHLGMIWGTSVKSWFWVSLGTLSWYTLVGSLNCSEKCLKLLRLRPRGNLLGDAYGQTLPGRAQVTILKDFHRGDLRVEPSKLLKSIFSFPLTPLTTIFSLNPTEKWYPKLKKFILEHQNFNFWKSSPATS